MSKYILILCAAFQGFIRLKITSFLRFCSSLPFQFERQLMFLKKSDSREIQTRLRYFNI